MTTSETHPSHWTLLRRPYWKGILIGLISFPVICLTSAPRSSLDFAVCAICTLGYVFLFDCFREFVCPAALRFLNWSLLLPLVFLFALVCAVGVEFAGRHFGIALTFTSPVQFMVFAAAAAAIGSMIARRLKPQSPVPPMIHPPIPPRLPGGEPFWNEMGMARSIPDYIQLHLALRSPQHTLGRRADGSIDVDAVPPLIINDPQIRNDITRLIVEQVPNDPSVLSSLSSDEIVSRLGGILTTVTGKDMYAVVIRKWCVEHKLL